MEKEKEKENVEVNHQQEEGVTPKTKTTKKKKKKMMTEEHESSEQKNHEQEEGVTKKTPTKKSEELESSEKKEGVTMNTKTPTTKKKKKSEELGSNGQEKGVTANTKTPTTKKKKSEEHESSEQEKGVTANMNTPTKKKESEEHESSELNSHSLVIALPATVTTTATKVVAAKKKIGNDVENVEEGSVSEKKKRKSKKKGMADETEKVEDRKMELNEESMEDLVKAKPDSEMTESCKEMGLEEKKIIRKRKKNKKKKRDENAMEVTNEFEGKMEVGLPTATDGDNEASSEHTKKKRCLSSVIVDMELDELEEAMQELMVKVKPASAAQTEENDMEVDTEKKKRKKRRRKRHDSECTKMDTKPLEDNLQDLSVKEKPEAVQQAVEVHEEVKTGQKVMKHQLSSSENGDGNQSQLKNNLKMKVITIPGIAFQASENHEQMSASKRKKMKKKEKKLIAREKLKKSIKELPVEFGLKDSLLADEKHVSRMKDKSAYDLSFKKPAYDFFTKKPAHDPSFKKPAYYPAYDFSYKKPVYDPAYDLSFKKPAYDLSFKQPVEKSGVSSSELLREVKTTQIVLDLPKSAPVGALCPHVGTKRKLLILDLNGLLLDIVMVVPRGYKAEKKIGPKSVFKRPFCDDFLKFCFERFEVGVWTSRTKRNMDDVLDFIMADMKHKLLFCWDQSHCTMTGINTIDNRHKPLVCKELSKLWDKHEPSLPWEKGEYNESNTLLLDDSPYKALLNPPNTAIFPYSYSLVDKNDNAIGPEGDIRLYLEGVAAAEDVQKYVKQHPFGQPAISETSSSWGFYCRVFDHFKRQLD